MVSVHPPPLFPGSAAILASISAGETPTLPGGGERLLIMHLWASLNARAQQACSVVLATSFVDRQNGLCAIFFTARSPDLHSCKAFFLNKGK